MRFAFRIYPLRARSCFSSTVPFRLLLATVGRGDAGMFRCGDSDFQEPRSKLMFQAGSGSAMQTSPEPRVGFRPLDFSIWVGGFISRLPQAMCHRCLKLHHQFFCDCAFLCGPQEQPDTIRLSCLVLILQTITGAPTT